MDQAMDVGNAKELFWRYGGNTYQMFRDGFYGEYEKFKISKGIEATWLREYANEKLNRLNGLGNDIDPDVVCSMFIRLVDLSVKLNDQAMFNTLRDYVTQKQCQIAKLSFLVMMEELLRESAKFPTEIKTTAAIASKITNKVLLNPIEEGHRLLLASGQMMETTAEQITNRFLKFKKKCDEIL